MKSFFTQHGASEVLAQILEALAQSCAQISDEILVTSTGKAGTQNSFGEEQIAMDVAAERVLEENLASFTSVRLVGSEELAEPKLFNEEGTFCVMYDPLDGSSLFDANLSVGTIIGIYESREVLGHTGRDMVAALYALYGPKTLLIVALPDGVYMGEWMNGAWNFSSEKIVLKNDKKYFAPGNLRATAERSDYLELVNAFMSEQYTLRYTGGMVPDIHHILVKGSGVFMYPGMPSAPQGKLRLLYECAPMAFIIEKAGGKALSELGSILDLKIESYSQRTPIFIGSPVEVQRVHDYLKQPPS